jgi:hypothetical protein
MPASALLAAPLSSASLEFIFRGSMYAVVVKSKPPAKNQSKGRDEEKSSQNQKRR